MTAQADIAALAERTARLEERSESFEKDHDDLQAQLRSLSNRVWGILVLLLANLLPLVIALALALNKDALHQAPL